MQNPKSVLGDNSIHLKVVTDAETLSHAMIVRSVAIYEELGLTVRQAFDGNDYQATHIVAYAGEEPIGATRIRWFRDFAKIERTCFRKAWRSARTLRQCSSFIFDHVARKGYATLITHAEPELARVWERVLGFEYVAGRPAVQTGDNEPYIELVKRLELPADVISRASEPKILFRIEGMWDEPCAYETN